MSDDVSGLIFYRFRAAFAYFQFPRIVKKLFELWIFTNKLYIQYDMISIYTFFFFSNNCMFQIYIYTYIYRYSPATVSNLCLLNLKTVPSFICYNM